MNKNMEEAILDLLCAQATCGLSEEQKAELERLKAEAGGTFDLESLELTAASLNVALLGELEPMPSHVQLEIAAMAKGHFAAVESQEERPDENIFTRPRRPAVIETEPKGSMINWLGWAVAAAACVALALNIWTAQRQDNVAKGPGPTPAETARPGPAELREQLIGTAKDLARAGWAAGNVKEITAVTGDVVWSDEKQEGYMRFRGLPANDPGREAYQLWIFDETQSEETPIDGGVFDISDEGEVVVPIDAKLKASKPALFAVTIEKPGGVVVSDRKRIAALAKVETRPQGPA